MKNWHLIIAALLIGLFPASETFAKPKKRLGGPPGLVKKGKVPSGLDQKGGVPPGLAKKGGVPPGIAKKYSVGQTLPHNAYRPLDPRYKSRLPYNAPKAQKWVELGDDLYLINRSTGIIANVVLNWLR